MCSKEELIETYKKIDKESLNKKRKILDTLKDRGQLTVEDNIVQNSNICFVLSCPGEKELLEGRVCCGDTGANLEKLISELLGCNWISITEGGNNGDERRYNFNIINASDRVYFRGYNGKSEPSDDEVKSPDNIERIEQEISKSYIEYFVLCGEKAELLQTDLAKIKDKAKFSTVCHLGDVGIRNTYRISKTKTVTGKMLASVPEEDRDSERIKLIAKTIKNDFCKE